MWCAEEFCKELKSSVKNCVDGVWPGLIRRTLSRDVDMYETEFAAAGLSLDYSRTVQARER
jgi:hypothetical protein